MFRSTDIGRRRHLAQIISLWDEYGLDDKTNFANIVHSITLDEKSTSCNSKIVSLNGPH